MKKYFIVLLMVLLSLSFSIAATYEINDSSISTIYSQNKFLSGWINISFDDQPLNSLFNDNEGNEITLKEVLNKSSNYVYSCKDNNCGISYSATTPTTTKNFDLISGEEKFIGMVFDGNIEEIYSINFNLSSNASAAEENQIKIDFFNDDKIEAGNTNIGEGTSGDILYGCFNKTGENLDEYTLGPIPFCQRIELKEAPAFEIGAWIEEVTPGENINISMELYYEDISLESEGGKCLIDKSNIPSGGGEVFCQVNVPVAEKEDYYVCINTEGAGGSYKIMAYDSDISEKNCGFNGIPKKSEIAAYQIGTKTVNYGPVNTIKILNDLPNGKKISTLVEDYITDTYGSLDCSQKDCYVPIKLIPSIGQNIDIDSIYINYKEYVGSKEEYKFYDFSKEPVSINSSFQKLYLDGLFKLPKTAGKYAYKLYFAGDKIFDDDINIEQISMSLYPLTAASNFPLTFYVNVESNLNFSSYQWNFGDGSAVTTSTENQKIHTYSTIGNYTLNLSATTEEGAEFLKSFEIIVEIPEKMINNAIIELETNIANLKQQINSLGTFEKEQLNKRINLDEIETNLSYIKEDMKIANDDSEYKQIMDSLFLIRIPKSIIRSFTNPIFYYSQKDNINLNILEEITQETAGDSEEVINSILFWNQNNLNAKISMEDILVKWDDVVEPYFKTFKLSINLLYTQDEEFYFIIKDIEGLDFKGNISMQETSGYKYLPLTEAQTLEFSTTKDVDFLTLPMFISPKLAQVQVEELILEKDTNKTLILIAILIALFFIGILIYSILQKWYKTKYEKYLFKEMNQLYNVATYIHNAKDNNISDSEIKKTLRNAGWNGEQINYALRKYAGRRTGMYEIPIKKLLKNKEAQVKQQQKDTKFNKGYSPK